MTKHRHQQNRAQESNRTTTSTSVGPEIPNQFKNQIEDPQSPSEGWFGPANEDIQRRAYQIHQEKGGSDFENWLEAEQVLKEEHRTAQKIN